MKIAVLFDGAGLARLGLERAGHECVGVELDPVKHHLSKFVGSGGCVLGDALTYPLDGFDAVWASPPCQLRSVARTQGAPKSAFAGDFVHWSLQINKPVVWVENVISSDVFGTLYNAAQFLKTPIQNRNRVVGGRFTAPKVFAHYKRCFPDICPCVTATEYKGCASDARRASRFYGRKLTLEECAYHQGFKIPKEWYIIPNWFRGTATMWRNQMYEAIGNGVPVYMAKAFGSVY